MTNHINGSEEQLRELLKTELFAAVEYGKKNHEATNHALQASYINHLDGMMEYVGDYVAAARQQEHDKIYALYTKMFEPNGGFRAFNTLKPADIMGFFEALNDLENQIKPIYGDKHE